jgi:hypothetical protein
MRALIGGMARCLITAVAVGSALAASAGAADFTQPARDAEFIKSARRQDKELLQFYGRTIPGGTKFSHLGSFQAVVHRDGLKRPAVLVPLANMRFDSAAAIKEAARGGDLVVGALKLSYRNLDPLIVPGTILLRYDGLRIHMLDLHEHLLAKVEASIGDIPEGAVIDEAVGSLSESETGLANILPDGTLQIFIQLADANGKELKDADGFRKVLLTCSVPGLVTDDNTPARVLVEPGEKIGGKAAKKKRSNDDSPHSGGGGGGHHH